MIFCDLFLFCYGLNLVQAKDPYRQPDFYANQVSTDSIMTYVAVITELPVEKEKSLKCDLRLLQIKFSGEWHVTQGNIIAYFKKSVGSKRLIAGETVTIRSRLSEVPSPKNPYEFDYQKYLARRQIFHTAFVDSLSFKVIEGEQHLNPIWLAGLRCKKYILDQLRQSSLSQNSFAICSALLTGYDDEIDKPVLDAFSHSGTLHVLSVSGLHTGLIYLALNFILGLIDKQKKHKIARFIFITLVLWFFALITGFSAPVLRAVIMFNLLGMGQIWFRARYAHQLNILLVSAFALLSYNPFFVTDVGFLLSYFALFGLIWFQPKISALWQPSNRLVSYTWQSISASVAATLSTLPITLFCFKQFPIWFFICNCVVVPATFVLLVLTLFVVLRVNFIALLVNYLVDGLVAFIQFFNHENAGFIDNVHFDFTDMIFLSLLIILLSAAIHFRSYKQLVVSLLLLLTWQFYSIADSFLSKRQNLFTAYQVKNVGAFSVKNKNVVKLYTGNDNKAFNYHVKPHLVSFNYPKIVSEQFNYIKYPGGSVLLVKGSGSWPSLNYQEVTTLVVSNNAKITSEVIQRFTNLKSLVLDGSNNQKSILRAAELSRKFGISFYNTKQQGAFILNL